MAETAQAQSYARAVFENAVDRYTHDLHTLNRALERGGVLTRLDNPAEPFEVKREIINSLLPEQADAVRNLAYLLATKNEMHLLPAVVAEFDRMVASNLPGRTARVTSAIELISDEKARLEDKLRREHGAELAFDYRVDPEIIGGVVVRIGDVVIDGSVAGKLAAMKQKLETAK